MNQSMIFLRREIWTKSRRKKDKISLVQISKYYKTDFVAKSRVNFPVLSCKEKIPFLMYSIRPPLAFEDQITYGTKLVSKQRPFSNMQKSHIFSFPDQNSNEILNQSTVCWSIQSLNMATSVKQAGTSVVHWLPP